MCHGAYHQNALLEFMGPLPAGNVTTHINKELMPLLMETDTVRLILLLSTLATSYPDPIIYNLEATFIDTTRLASSRPEGFPRGQHVICKRKTKE